MNVILVRDLTDSLYNPSMPPFVSHDRGTELVIGHIEKYWCPSIHSEVGAEGLLFEPETEIVLASGADQFAAACISLLRDPARCAKMGEAARRRAKAIHNPALISETLAAIVLDAMQARKHATAEVKTAIAC